MCMFHPINELITFYVFKDTNFLSSDNTCFSINVIDRFFDISIQENKYVDPFEVYIGHFWDTEIENKDEIDKPLEGFSISQLDEEFEKKKLRGVP